MMTMTLDRRQAPWRLACVFAWGLLAMGSAFAQTTYTVIELGGLPLGTHSVATGLNALGEAVGSSSLPNGDFHAVRYGSGGVADLGAFSTNWSEARAINDNGTVVGSSYTNKTKSTYHAVVFKGAALRPQDLGTLGGTISTATGISNAGLVVGSADTAFSGSRAFTYQIGKSWFIQSLPGLGGASWAAAVNRDGLIVGSAELPNGVAHAVAWRKGVITDLGLLALNNTNATSSASAVASNGLIAGQSTADDGGNHPFLIGQDGVMRDLGLFAGSRDTTVRGVNAAGVVVGLARLRRANYHTPPPVPWVLLEGVGLVDINTRLSLPPGSKITNVSAVNDLGQIAATATGPDNAERAVLLTPN